MPSADTRPAAVRAVRVLVGLVVAGLVLVGCVPAKHQASAPTGNPTTAAAPTPELASFYGQLPEWTSCSEGECATITVPTDYANPAAGSLTLALARHRATGERIGSLLINPGGPGVSGVDFLSSALDRIGKDVQERYDVVAFDPRGVQRSNPVRCADGPQLDELFAYDVDGSTDQGIQEATDLYAGFAAGCAERTGLPELGHVDTISAAKDLDVMRAVLGDDVLHYLGFSYGTELGATYAALFPEKVGRLVLDGALDPTLTDDEVSEGQAVGIEGALAAYIADCQQGKGCPLTGGVDHGKEQLRELFDKAIANPLPTGTDRPLTGSLAFYGVAVALYSKSYWPLLTQALTPAIQRGDGSGLLQLADAYFERNADGTYASNNNEAFYAINCVDSRSDADVDAMRAEAAHLAEIAPTVGSFFGYGGIACAKWPVPAVEPLESYAAEGAAPILVIGTTNDPATPYKWAEKLASTLSSGELLTYEGEGHAAYGTSNECVANAVDTYLVDGTMPPKNTRC